MSKGYKKTNNKIAHGVLLRLHREMAVDYLQVQITTDKELGPHNCPE